MFAGQHEPDGHGIARLGLGASSGFSPTNHDYSRTVWGTVLTATGDFRNLYYWSEGTPISFFE